MRSLAHKARVRRKSQWLRVGEEQEAPETVPEICARQVLGFLQSARFCRSVQAGCELRLESNHSAHRCRMQRQRFPMAAGRDLVLFELLRRSSLIRATSRGNAHKL